MTDTAADLWAEAERLRAAEQPLTARLTAARRDYDRLARDPRLNSGDPEERGLLQVDVARAGKAAAAARADLAAAAHATDVAIVAADAQDPEFGEGLAAQPPPMARGAVRLTHPVDGCEIVIAAGQRPPRWAAHRLGPHVFEPEPPAAAMPDRPEIAFSGWFVGRRNLLSTSPPRPRR